MLADKKQEYRMLGNKWVVLVAALAFWGAFFYFIDKSIMESQGLPVGADLMPK